MVNKFTHGVRPTVEFHHARRSTRTSNAMLGKVCIIGAFPCVSEKLETFEDLASAREKLNITPDKNDLYKTTNINGELVDNENYYPGAGALRWAFMQGTNEPGATEVLVCNISTQNLEEVTEGNNKIIQPTCPDDIPSYNTTLFHGEHSGKEGQSKLDVVLSKLKGEEFDSLIFAYDLTDPAMGVVKNQTDEFGRDVGVVEVLEQLKDWTHDNYTVKNPIGMYIGLNVPPKANITEETTTTGEGDNATTVTVTTTYDASVTDSVVETNKSRVIDRAVATAYADIFKDPVHNAHSLYSIVFNSLESSVRDYMLPPIEVAAYLAGLESGLPVDTIMGQRTLPTITGVDEELNYDPYYADENEVQNDGIYLLGHGVTCFECTNRTNNTWAIVNSMQPCQFDISHLRTSAYIIKQIVLTPFLCKLNNDVTRESIDSVVASIKDRNIDRFPGVISIDHHIEEKTHPRCVEIFLYINFYGIIINECVYVAMEVEGNE